MNKKIIIFTVLLTNFTFTYALPIEVRITSEISETKKNSQSFIGKSVTALYEKGLEINTAQNKVIKALQHDLQLSDVMAQNLLKHFDELKHSDIVSYISDKALFDKSIDLSSYDHLLSFAQKTDKLSLTEQTLQKLQKISIENQKLIL
ncbi:MAG: hypothetical protein OQK11_10865 [Thiovulaceae bacterium]|nr:hypothetical protein [Sulfurimonadaceae bacterium]